MEHHDFMCRCVMKVDFSNNTEADVIRRRADEYQDTDVSVSDIKRIDTRRDRTRYVFTAASDDTNTILDKAATLSANSADSSDSSDSSNSPNSPNSPESSTSSTSSESEESCSCSACIPRHPKSETETETCDCSSCVRAVKTDKCDKTKTKTSKASKYGKMSRSSKTTKGTQIVTSNNRASQRLMKTDAVRNEKPSIFTKGQPKSKTGGADRADRVSRVSRVIPKQNLKQNIDYELNNRVLDESVIPPSESEDVHVIHDVRKAQRNVKRPKTPESETEIEHVVDDIVIMNNGQQILGETNLTAQIKQQIRSNIESNKTHNLRTIADLCSISTADHNNRSESRLLDSADQYFDYSQYDRSQVTHNEGTDDVDEVVATQTVDTPTVGAETVDTQTVNTQTVNTQTVDMQTVDTSNVFGSMMSQIGGIRNGLAMLFGYGSNGTDNVDNADSATNADGTPDDATQITIETVHVPEARSDVSVTAELNERNPPNNAHESTIRIGKIVDSTGERDVMEIPTAKTAEEALNVYYQNLAETCDCEACRESKREEQESIIDDRTYAGDVVRNPSPECSTCVESSACMCSDSECNPNANREYPINGPNTANEGGRTKIMVQSKNRRVQPHEKIEALNRVISNMSGIDSYLTACHMHMDTMITILKDVFVSLQQILTPIQQGAVVNYMTYDAARLNVRTLLQQIDLKIKTAKYKNLPIFAAVGQKYIKFPMLSVTDPVVDRYLDTHFPTRQRFFKMELLKLSVRELRLKRYTFEPVKKGQQITPYTNPLPADPVEYGNPDKTMYSDRRLIKSWDPSYHLERFEKALYKIVMAKEALSNYSKTLRYRKSECLKIREYEKSNVAKTSNI